MKGFFRAKRRKSSLVEPEEPPIWFGPRRIGRLTRSPTANETLIRKLTLERADENARRLGMDRREFLASAMAAGEPVLASWAAAEPAARA